MQLWPKPKNLAVKQRSSIKNMTLRPRPKLMGVKSGVKGSDERHSTAPLTPLPAPTPLHALDTANVVRDVKPLQQELIRNSAHKPNKNKVLASENNLPQSGILERSSHRYIG
jgi:hypothetical protein